MGIKKKLLSSLLILGSVFTAGAVTTSVKDSTPSKAAIDLPGGLSCDESMNSTTHSLSGPVILEVSSLLTEAERIVLIKENFTVSQTKVTCKSDGNLSSVTTPLSGVNVTVIKNTSSSNETYTVSYSGATSKTVTLNVVVDGYEPVISGELNYTSNVDSPITVDDIKSNMTALDETDGEVEVYVIEDNFTANKNKVGTYTISFGAKDKTGNEARVTVNVLSVDTTKPIINGSDRLTRKLSSDLTIDEIVALYTVSDNVDVGLVATLSADNYTANKNLPGKYEVVLSTTDKSGNVGTKSIIIEVIDDVKPTISGSKNEWTKSVDKVLTIDSLLLELTYSDNVSTLTADNVIKVSDDYTGNANRVGTYEVVIAVYDEAGNRSEDFTITIKVTDSIPPVFWANGDFFVFVDTQTTLSAENIAYVARELGMFDRTRTVQIDILANDYVGNETIEGDYNVTLKGTYENGESVIGSLTLSVSNTAGSIVIEGEKEPESKKWSEKLWDGFVYIITFQWLKPVFNFVKWVFGGAWKLLKNLIELIVWIFEKLF